MAAAREDLPEDIDALRTALLVERARAARVEAELAVARAKASEDEALIAHQRLQIEKLTRQLYGPRSERTVRLLDQMELAFEELESSASEDEIAAERAAAKTTNVVAFTRQRPARQPFPDQGGSAAQPVDPGRPGGGVLRGADAAAAASGGARLCRRTTAR